MKVTHVDIACIYVVVSLLPGVWVKLHTIVIIFSYGNKKKKIKTKNVNQSILLVWYNFWKRAGEQEVEKFMFAWCTYKGGYRCNGSCSGYKACVLLLWGIYWRLWECSAKDNMHLSQKTLGKKHYKLRQRGWVTESLFFVFCWLFWIQFSISIRSKSISRIYF